jgi:hypothetical protein
VGLVTVPNENKNWLAQIQAQINIQFMKIESAVKRRGYWSLELIFLDENLANQGFKDIFQIIQFVELAFILRFFSIIMKLYLQKI